MIPFVDARSSWCFFLHFGWFILFWLFFISPIMVHCSGSQIDSQWNSPAIFLFYLMKVLPSNEKNNTQTRLLVSLHTFMCVHLMQLKCTRFLIRFSSTIDALFCRRISFVCVDHGKSKTYAFRFKIGNMSFFLENEKKNVEFSTQSEDSSNSFSIW